MSWKVIHGSDEYDAISVKYIRTVSELNYATVKVAALIDPDESVYLNYDGANVFQGVVKKCESDDSIQYKLTIREQAVELKDLMVYEGTITYTATTVNALIATLLSGTGWSIISGNPGSTAVINSITFSWMHVLPAINEIIKLYAPGCYLWFDSINKYVGFGTARPTPTGGATDIEEWVTVPKYSSDKRNIDKVIVLGPKKVVQGSYGSGSKVIVYQYMGSSDTTDLTAIATRIYNELSTTSERDVVKTWMCANIYEGTTVSINGSGSYIVQDVTMEFSQNKSEVDVGLDYNYMSVFDQYGDNLKLLEGEVLEGANVTWDGSPQNVGGP